MKKRILASFALTILATAAYAQIIQQVGQQQYAQHNQSGANQVGLIEQRQNATPSLNGVNYGNYAITFQGTPTNTGANQLTIQQNDGSQGNRSGISQDGGPSNNAIITQNGGPDGLSGGGTSASATIGAPGGDGNFAGIAQTGAGNAAAILENNNSRRNTGEIYQNGTINQALMSQSHNSVNNRSFIYQGYTGSGIAAAPTVNAFAQIQQGRASDTDVALGAFVLPEAVGNLAIVTQTASNVKASIGQGGLPFDDNTAGRSESSRATIVQSAVQTEALIYQGAGGGETIGTQASIDQSALGSGAFIYQGVFGLGSDEQSTATIQQTSTGGGTNAATVVQGYFSATHRDQATIAQTGTATHSSAQILQGTGSNGGTYSSGDVATISQMGKGTLATINQNSNLLIDQASGQSSGQNNSASITQEVGVVGNGALSTNGAGGFTVDPTATGVALIDQGVAVNGAVLQANRNTAAINQVSGTGLRAHIAQGRDGALQDAAGNIFTLNGLNGTPVSLVGTLANDNVASIAQLSGNAHTANIFQDGRFNTATVTQSNGNGSQALIVQTTSSQRALASISQTSGGINNVATILQFAGSNADGSGQYGNVATISQVAGSNNVAFLQQGLQGSPSSSNDNAATITQNGSNNFARFLQVGNNNSVDITQNGNNNKVLNMAGDPGSFGSQQGYNNRLTLVQEGGNMGVTYRYSQIGNNNTQVVTQHF
ncbi:hypothetical protein GCM10027341_41320 [Spirosoma knui]